jgi:hypothetical protein
MCLDVILSKPLEPWIFLKPNRYVVCFNGKWEYRLKKKVIKVQRVQRGTSYTRKKQKCKKKKIKPKHQTETLTKPEYDEKGVDFATRMRENSANILYRTKSVWFFF